MADVVQQSSGMHHSCEGLMRTRYWSSNEGSSTCVQWRDDVEPHIWLHTNLGWVPLGGNEDQSEQAAEEIAQGYNLVERSQEVALEMAGIESSEPDYNLDEAEEW